MYIIEVPDPLCGLLLNLQKRGSDTSIVHLFYVDFCVNTEVCRSMTRPKRINLPHCLYHVLSRTNSGYIAFENKHDEDMFLDYLARYSSLLKIRIHAYCLMKNHFHLLIETGPVAALSVFMHRLMTSYTFKFNRRHNRRGHLFQGRYKSFIVDKSGYLLAVSRYVHLNPSPMGKESDLLNYPASSLQFYANGGEPDFLHTGEILGWFDHDRSRYVDFVMEGLEEDTAPPTLQQRYVGNQAFAERARRRIATYERGRKQNPDAPFKRNREFEEIELAKAEKIVNLVAEYFDILPHSLRTGHKCKGVNSRARKALINLLLENVSWSHKELAEFLKLQYINAVWWHQNTLDIYPELEKDLELLRAVLKGHNRSV